MKIFKRNAKKKGGIHLDKCGRQKYSDPIEKRKSELNRNYTRYGIIFTVWCTLIFLAVQVDKEYYSGSGGCFAGLVACFVDLGHNWNINYEFLYQALGGYSSILLAVMGMIVTGWLSLSDRLENAVYGIRRRELFAKSWIRKYLEDSFIGVFSTPAWMAYVMIRKYCFAAYLIMILIFAQFMVSVILLAKTYNRNHDYIRLCKKIKYSLKGSAKEKGFDVFDTLLDRIEVSIEKNTDWKEVNSLFLSCIGDSKEQGEEDLYRISWDFLNTVYAKRNQERIIALSLTYMQEVSEGYRVGDDEKTKLVYWTILDCLYHNCNEKQLADCVEGLLDMFSLGDTPSYMWRNIPIEWIVEIFAMVALETECWLRANDSRQRRFGKNFSKIIRLGRAVYVSEEKSKKLLRFINIREEVLKETGEMMYRSFDCLRESYLGGEQQRHIASLLWSAAEIYR